MARRSHYFTGHAAADALVSKDPLALLIGMVLDQQIPLEWAFRGPAELEARLGRPLDAAQIAAMDPGEFAELFARKPALHRYPASMAARVQELCRVVAEDYGGDAASIWKSAADGRDVLARLKALPGFGDMKAKILVALLGKQFGLRADGWQAAAKPYGDPGTSISVADIVDAKSFDRVRQTKQALKAAKKAGATKSGTTKSGTTKSAKAAARRR